ncbi:MAG: L-glutamate gamma-semialdehyde dehydrogenase [Candidatus Sericytochromatia bacterium]
MSSPLPPFQNEAFVDFSQPENMARMQAALEKVASQFGQSYPMLINGEEVTTGQTFTSYNPCQRDQIVGTFALGTVEHAEQAIQAAHAAFPSWSRVPAAERAQYLLKAAAKMREERFELSAVMVYEVGKSWAEADGDLAEAIDFLEFYAREMLRLDGPHPVTPYPGEDNEVRYIPLGVGAIIPPWNFPLAILTGMSAAAIVTGNPVVLKPAEESMLTGWQFVRIMQSLGLPKGVLNFITGDGAELGPHMVSHPLTRFINFTGSKAVGLQIVENAAKMAPGQKWIKRVVAELGGKDAIVVDADADLEAAAQGIVAAAFGFQGQKCSACSRAIVHQDVYEQVLQRVADLTLDLRVGPVEDPQMQMGAVINQESEDRVLHYIALGKTEGRLVVGGEKLSEAGHFIAPTVIADLAPEARVAQDEIFGPVVAFIKARDFDEALQIANDTDYGLTGALYSGNEAHLQRAREEFFVGNLYLNRKCTGALVDVHPFGGFNLSGTDSKAGGRDYLLQFLQAKSISRKVL